MRGLELQNKHLRLSWGNGWQSFQLRPRGSKQQRKLLAWTLRVGKQRTSVALEIDFGGAVPGTPHINLQPVAFTWSRCGLIWALSTFHHNSKSWQCGSILKWSSMSLCQPQQEQLTVARRQEPHTMMTRPRAPFKQAPMPRQGSPPRLLAHVKFAPPALLSLGHVPGIGRPCQCLGRWLSSAASPGPLPGVGSSFGVGILKVTKLSGSLERRRGMGQRKKSRRPALP